MRAVIQRVKFARVKVRGEVVAEIGQGVLVLLGIGKGDGEEDMHWLANKIINLRIFEDEDGKINRSIIEIGGEILLVSQFTLYADCRKGRRPSFDLAMQADKAEGIFNAFFNYLKAQGIEVQKGIFGERMEIELLNYGPVTIILDSKGR